MKRKFLLLMFLLVFFSQLLTAQEQPVFNPTNYVDSTGKLYWNRYLPVYVFLSPNPDGSDAKKLNSEISAKYADPFYFDTEGKNYMRTHWAVDKETKKPVVPQQEILWEVYADGIAPKTTAHFNYNKSYRFQNKMVYDQSLGISLSSFDATSKVKEIYYSLNGENYKIYAGMIKNFKEGENTIKFFAVDNVNNVEQVRQVSFVIDKTPPKSEITITGISLKDNVISLSTRIYIEAKDNFVGTKQIFYQIDSLKTVAYQEGTHIPLSSLKDGDHTLKYYSIDEVGNKEQPKTFNFFLDRTAPITVSDILGDKFIVDNKVYFSGRTKMKITSIDNKSGVKQVLYSIDGSEFKEYSDPFYMPNEPGWHIVKYFAIDSTENLTKDQYSQQYLQYKMKVDKIYVDLTGPTISHFISGDKYKRGDTTFIGPNSKINLSGYDKESGLQMITYSIDGELKETPYIKPFTLSNFKSGIHKIEYFGYDNVNNRNIKNFEVVLDNSGPQIDYKFSVKPIDTSNETETYPYGTYLFITVQDDMTGVGGIYYSINGGQKLSYKNYIKNLKKGQNTINVEAYDKLGNKSVLTITFIIE